MPLIETNGIMTRYEMQGSGPALVLVSGLGGVGAYWAAQVAALAQQFTVITYDQRGAGGSDHPEMVYSIELLADDLEALIDGLGLERPAMIGHSTGGAIGQVLAARRPDLFRAMVQYASWAWSDAHFNWCFRMRRALLAATGIEEYVHGSALFLYPPDYLRDHAEALSARLLASAAGFPPRAVVLARIDAIMAHDARALLPAIRTPTLVLCAEDDILTPPYQSELLARDIPGATLRLVPKGGHGLSETEPALFNGIVLAFLAGTEMTSGEK